MSTSSEKVREWATDKNDFFCIHDVAGFFNQIDKNTLSSAINKLVEEGNLTRTDTKQTCKMSDRIHSYYIINKSKPQAMESIQKIKIGGRTGKTQRVKDFIKEKGDVCIHDIAKLEGTHIYNVSSLMTQLDREGFIKKMPEKVECPVSNLLHSRYKYAGKPNEKKAVMVETPRDIDGKATENGTHYIYGRMAKTIYNEMKRLGTFCAHDIAKALNRDVIDTSSRIGDFEDMGVALRKDKKGTCKYSGRMHMIYKFNEDAKIKIFDYKQGEKTYEEKVKKIRKLVPKTKSVTIVEPTKKFTLPINEPNTDGLCVMRNCPTCGKELDGYILVRISKK